jgi:serine protease inhibitor
MKKMLYGLFGFALGFVAATAFFLPELKAQSAFSGAGSAFQESQMQPSLPAKYGKLIAVSGIDLYFQGNDGTVYIVKPRTGNVLDTQVTMIKMGEARPDQN